MVITIWTTPAFLLIWRDLTLQDPISILHSFRGVNHCLRKDCWSIIRKGRWSQLPDNEVLPNIDIHENFVGRDSGCYYQFEQCGTVLCCGRKPLARKILQDCEEQQYPGANGFCHRYLLEGNIYSLLQDARNSLHSPIACIWYSSNPKPACRHRSSSHSIH